MCGKDKKISFRLTTEQYYSTYCIYEKYLINCPNLTFSDFLRNLILSITATVEEKQNEQIKENS